MANVNTNTHQRDHMPPWNEAVITLGCITLRCIQRALSAETPTTVILPHRGPWDGTFKTLGC